MITNTDIAKVIDLLTAAYGEKAFPVGDPRQLAKVTNLWSVMFADDDPAEVLTAVKNCIATLQFPPKIADVKSRIAQNRLAGQLTEIEVWQMIRTAVEDSTSRDRAREIFANLPKIVQAVAGSPSQLRAWRTVSDEQFETVVMSLCSRTYRTLAQREAGYYALPADVQAAEPWRLTDAPKQLTLPEPEPARYEIPAEWNRNRAVSDSVMERLTDFLGGEDENL